MLYFATQNVSLLLLSLGVFFFFFFYVNFVDDLFNLHAWLL